MRRLGVIACCLALFASLPFAPARAQLEQRNPVDYVDPFIGTLGGGFAFPGPSAPYGMVQLSPDTDGYLAYTGYMYHDQFIRGFSHHHIESMGVKSNGNLPFMPTVGPVVSNDPRLYWSKFDHATEDASAGYYRVLLERYGIDAELTTGTRVGMHRYTFPPSPQSNVILDVGRSNKEWEPWDPSTSVHQSSLEVVDESTVVGSADSDQSYTIYFAAKFDRPFDSFGAWDAYGDAPVEGKGSAAGKGAGGYVSFDTTSDRDVLVKVGISSVSRANALMNLDAEKPDWDFDALRNKTRARWSDALSTIEVDGATDGDKTSFYTALYHAQQHPNVYSDVNGEYMGHDKQVHVTDGHEHYANFSLWDTYRGENQLLATIAPDRYRDMMLSLLDIYDQVGRFPQWAMNDALPDYMVGDPVQMTIVDGYCRDILDGTDVNAFYDALRHQAFDVRRAWNADYLDRGWIHQGASETLEYALADFALALMADSMGYDSDRDLLLERARNYAHVIDPASGFARPRNADGSWKTPYAPEEPDHFVEGTGWQYTWLAPQDLSGLFDLVGAGGGGQTRAERIQIVRDRLDTFFSTAVTERVPAVTPEAQQKSTGFGVFYAGNQYAPSNEHDIHAPYLYDYAGQPWKTQGIMRGYQGLFRPTPDGLPGNDDLGSMSAWFVWSALGFYPVTGGAPVYAVGSPVFESAVIRPAGTPRRIEVRAPGASAVDKYVQSATLGDAALDRPWFTHAELFRAGRVELPMGPTANESWGSDPAAAPPSLSTHDLSAFGCPPLKGPKTTATGLTYVGDTRVQGETVNLAASLMTESGSPVAGRQVAFEIAGRTVEATTGPDGHAAVAVEIPDHGRSQLVIARFRGDSLYLPSETAATVQWGKGPKS
ncbi:MAG TPA: GH92 family glycosyl hydrolase [Actinomycetota bacterium]|jgi:predicted alpha-1,2-mannosidase